jgi:hypothetical protein
MFNKIMPEETSANAFQRNDTVFLRALAICLIINTHMRGFYPIEHLATGGMIGNALFFMLSSLGLYLSWAKSEQSQFSSWYGKRLIRIYPSAWITVILTTIPIALYSGTIQADSFLRIVDMFFFPPFWFIQALLIYYFIIYFVLKHYSKKLLVIVAIPVLLLYCAYYELRLDLMTFAIENNPFNIIFYFFVYLWGLYLGSIKERIHFSGIGDTLLLLLLIAFIYFHKFLMTRGLFTSIQFIQHIAVFPMLFYFLKVAQSDFIVTTIMKNRFFGKISSFLCKRTLEIFMVNIAIYEVISLLKLEFPANAIAYVGINLVLAAFIFSGSKYIRRILENG